MAVQSVKIDKKAGTLTIVCDLEPGNELSTSGKMYRWGGSDRGFERVTNIVGANGMKEMHVNVFAGTKKEAAK